jgi:hypothetical protein
MGLFVEGAVFGDWSFWILFGIPRLGKKIGSREIRSILIKSMDCRRITKKSAKQIKGHHPRVGQEALLHFL